MPPKVEAPKHGSPRSRGYTRERYTDSSRRGRYYERNRNSRSRAKIPHTPYFHDLGFLFTAGRSRRNPGRIVAWKNLGLRRNSALIGNPIASPLENVVLNMPGNISSLMVPATLFAAELLCISLRLDPIHFFIDSVWEQIHADAEKSRKNIDAEAEIQKDAKASDRKTQENRRIALAGQEQRGFTLQQAVLYILDGAKSDRLAA